MCDRIQVTLFCSVPNSNGRPLMYKMHEWMKVLVSSRLPEKGSGDMIFGSLKEDWAGGVCGNGICEGVNQGGVRSGWEPDGRGRE